MIFPNELTEAMVDCISTCFFHSYKMEAFLQDAGVEPIIIQRHRGQSKAVCARAILADLARSNKWSGVQRRVLIALCELTNAPDNNGKVDRDAALATIVSLRDVAMRYRESLACATFDTSDLILDGLLDTARHKFLEPNDRDRREALEKLWDAWERLKTLEGGGDKKTATGILLHRASPDPAFRQVLEVEARALTDIGNSFMIRHTEVGKTPIQNNEHVDYLFHRMFDLIRLLLRTTGRAS